VRDYGHAIIDNSGLVSKVHVLVWDWSDVRH